MGSETDSGSSESDEAYLNRRFLERRGSMHSSKKPSFNALTPGSRMAAEQPVRFVKEKAKGILKVAAPKVLEKKEPVRSPSFDLTKVGRRGADDNYFLDPRYGGDWNAARRATVAKSGSLKSKNKDSIKSSALDMQSDFGEEDPDEYVRTSSYLNRRKNSDLAVTVASYDSYDYSPLNKMKKLKPSEDWKYPDKDLPRGSILCPSDKKQSYIPKHADFTRGISHLSDANNSCSSKRRHPTGRILPSSDANQSRRHAHVYGESFCHVQPSSFGDSSLKGQKGNVKDDFRTSKSFLGFDYKVGSCKVPSAERSGSSFRTDRRNKILQDQLRRGTDYHEGAGFNYSRKIPVNAQSEETQSDSSGQVEEGKDMYPYSSNSVHPSTAMVAHQSGVKLEHDYKMSNRLAKSTIKGSHPPDGGMSCRTPELEPYTKKVKKKGKANVINYSDDDKSKRKGQENHFSEKLQPLLNGSCAKHRKRKGTSDVQYSLEQANDMCHVRGISDEASESLNFNTRLTVKERQTNRSENRSQISTDYTMENDPHERSSLPIMGCNSLPKKKKGKGGEEYLDELDQHYSSPKRHVEENSSVRKKKGKRKADAVDSSVVIPEPMIPDKGGAELEMDRSTHKKPFTLITPTIHTGFSFSIIHLLSAVRKALITTQMEDTEEIGNHLGKDNVSMLAKGDQNKFLISPNDTFLSQSLDNLEGSIHGGPRCNLSVLSVQEIVHRVKSNPGDPCILETPEPLQDLVRGVLKIFSSKTAPLGAKGWKTLVLYEKSNKSWSWVGPVSSNSSDNDNTEEETSAEVWGIPHKMLVKLVDAFANWLKNGQETLQQIGTLPAPPAVLPVMDYKDRFRDLRAQKSLSTISPSSEELRAYFHREELLRYSIPDRAFQYTAVDGRKSIVAPLRRGGGKPTSKARDHYMLKTDRPPHVTVLCLVRDAAARLPGSIGTRADVCTLIRDSQYIVEDVTDAQVNQVVSGALDRLHYERDPCVQFDGERKLWVYLHQDREEEDFEDDGTSSTKKWKRQRKDPVDPPEVEPNNESNYLATEPTAGGSSTCDFNSDLNIVASDAIMDEKGELVYNDLRPNRENVQSFVSPALCERGQSSPINWGFLGGNTLQETKMLCQENSTNQDFDDESFSRERPVGLLSASLF